MKKNQNQTIQLYDHNGNPSIKVKKSDLQRIGATVSKGTKAVDTKDGERHYIKQ